MKRIKSVKLPHKLNRNLKVIKALVQGDLILFKLTRSQLIQIHQSMLQARCKRARRLMQTNSSLFLLLRVFVNLENMRAVWLMMKKTTNLCGPTFLNIQWASHIT